VSVASKAPGAAAVFSRAQDTCVSRIQSIRSRGCLQSHRTRVSVASKASGAAAVFSRTGQVCQSSPKHLELRLSSVAQCKVACRLQSIWSCVSLQSHSARLRVASKASGAAAVFSRTGQVCQSSSVAQDKFVSSFQSTWSCGCLQSHRTSLSVVSKAHGAASLFSHTMQSCVSLLKHPELRLSSVAQDKFVSRLQSIRSRGCLRSHKTSLSVASEASRVSILFSSLPLRILF